MILVLNYLFGISGVYGTDIGFYCVSDIECKAGNGGHYSLCSSFSSVCVCKVDHLGKENMDELVEDYQRCHHSNKCNKKDGCDILCVPEVARPNKNNVGCKTVIFCNKSTKCSIGCQPKDLGESYVPTDWYGLVLPDPFVSDFIPETNTSVCYDPDRALNSRPKGIVIKTSDIPGAGLGVFSEEYIPRGTVIGPYKGKRVRDESVDDNWTWTIPGTEWKVDANDKTLSNWVRYINHANTVDSQNLAPVAYNGEMYYIAFKSIQRGTELLVWYGDGYAAKFGQKKRETTRYAYAKDGYVGGRCLSRDYEDIHGVRCFDKLAMCMTVICLCQNESHARGSECIKDESVAGRCFGKDGDMCRTDENAQCRNGVCICNDNSSQMNNKCIKDETYAGRCRNWTGDCGLDKNAECVNGLCECKYGTSEISGKCFIDGSLGGYCKYGQCQGKNIVCNIDTSFCVCKTDFIEKGGNCIKR